MDNEDEFTYENALGDYRDDMGDLGFADEEAAPLPGGEEEFADEAEPAVDRVEGMQFCPQCNSLMGPHVNAEKALEWKCTMRECGETKPASSTLVYSNTVKRSSMDQLRMVHRDLANDPALPRDRSVACPQCADHDTVYLLAKETVDSKTYARIFLCRRCFHKWIQ